MFLPIVRQMFSSNTIFYLTPAEAVDLLSTLSGTGDDYGMSSNYSYIIVTKSDISPLIKTSNQLNRKEKLRKNIFLVSPHMENTGEYQNYFETMVNTVGSKGDQPLIAEFRRANQPIAPDISVAPMAKAVWALTQAYQVCDGSIRYSSVNLMINFFVFFSTLFLTLLCFRSKHRIFSKNNAPETK